MEEIIRVKKEDGVYDCDVSITVEEWKELLQDKEITTEKILRILLLYYNEPNHASTSENLSQKFGGTRQSYFVPISGFGYSIQKKLNRFTVKGRKGENAYCVITLIGRYVDNRYFEQRLRPELVQAMEELGLAYNAVRDDFVYHKDNEIKYSKYANLLLANKNIVLTGAPGTGKSYLAKRIAEEITGKGGDIGFVQFHPSYDYTDFVEGLRAEEVGDGGVSFKLKNGVFKEFCKAAIVEPEKNFVFIIDEINRGEICKIFGELFFSIDPGYRGKVGKVKTQYQNLHSNETDTIFDSELGRGWFYVPENVYIIGTMNDIDRSVESMDFAMRRRFTWVEIDAESRVEMFDEYDWAEEAKDRMMAINSEIDQVEGLGKAYHIGPAYFLRLESYRNNASTMWGQLWDLHIEPLVKEYLRGMPSSQRELEKIKAAYDGNSYN